MHAVVGDKSDDAHLVEHRTGGASPFGNRGVVYKGSPDDAALNAGVLRYQADPQAVARARAARAAMARAMTAAGEPR